MRITLSASSHSSWCQILLIVSSSEKKIIYHPPLFGLIMAYKAELTALFSPLQALLFCVSHRYLWIRPPPFTSSAPHRCEVCQPLSSSHYLGSCLRLDSGCALVLVLLVGQHLVCFLVSRVALETRMWPVVQGQCLCCLSSFSCHSVPVDWTTRVFRFKLQYP